jgi:signal peptidase II
LTEPDAGTTIEGRRSNTWLFFAILVVTLILDQVVKAWARGAMPEGGSLAGLPWPGVFEFKLVYNEGVAFGLFSGAGRYLSPIAVAIAAGAAWYSLKHPSDSKWSHLAMGLLASGAIGNLYDRLFLGRVTDMFWFRLIDFPVFNIADACITVATAILIVTWWREAFAPSEREKAVAAETPATPEAD